MADTSRAALNALSRVFPDRVVVVDRHLTVKAIHGEVVASLGVGLVAGADLLSLPGEGPRALRDALANPVSKPRVEWVNVVDGRLRSWEARAVEGEEGDWVCVVRDLTALRRAEVGLAAEKERLTVTLRSIQDGVISTDRDGRIVLMNPAAERLLGVNTTEVRHSPITTTFWDLADLPPEGSSDGTTVTLVDSEGRSRHVRLGTFPVLQHGQLLGAVYTLRDITDERSAEAERLRASKLESVGVLAGGIAHDFNNLLASIMGNTTYLRHAYDDEELLEVLDDVELATSRAAALTRQLLTFSKGGAPMTSVRSVGPLVEEAVGFGTRGTNVRPEVTLAGDPHADVDEGQLQQVLQNLVINACQAMPEGGTLHVAVGEVRQLPEALGSKSGPWVLVSLRDEGVGIPEADKPRIFDPYFTTKPKGTGLGLAAAYAVVSKHGGHLTVDSTVGQGSTFHVFLPSASAPVDLGDDGEEPLPQLSGRVLVMDDEASIRRVAQRLCGLMGVDVVACDDGAEAVKLYRAARREGRSYDAVLLDLTIPGGMGGEEAVQRILDIDPEAVCIATSGYATGGVLSDYRSYGFEGRLAKPFDARSLAAVLSMHLPTRVGAPPPS
jgi:PAS domain S-box-containing protein